MIDWKAVSEEADKHGYMSGVDRQSDRVLASGEIFTPTELVCEMCQHLIDRDPDALAPGKTVLDPSCGDGQFLVVAKWVKVLHYGMTEADAVKDLYGVDIMRDNVDLCKKRLGGGNIVMGNTLRPRDNLPEQTSAENKYMVEWFDDETNLEDYFL